VTVIERLILQAAAGFIRQHPNGIDSDLKTLMADTLSRLAATPGVPAVKVTKKEPAQTELPTVVAGPSDNDIRQLLYAGGYKHVHDTTFNVYSLLVRNVGKEFSSAVIAKRLKMGLKDASAQLVKLAQRGVIKRVGHGVYVAT
jgi:predicted Rossmann fold nucleotide-binding protein DprA/Smf involved in DNA uptake